MIDSKFINIVNRILKNYGINESLDKTSLDMIDCLNSIEKNKHLMNLFDKYDKGELSIEQITINYDNGIFKEIDNIIKKNNELIENNIKGIDND